MWKLLLSLWSVPLLLGTVLLMRSIDGVPLIKNDERLLWLGRPKDIRLSLWMGIKFALIAIVLFFAGLVEGIILPNLNVFFQIAVPVLTTVGAILLLLGWLRWRVPPIRTPQQSSAQARAYRNRTTDFFFR
jgi:hypothetical protein